MPTRLAMIYFKMSIIKGYKSTVAIEGNPEMWANVSVLYTEDKDMVPFTYTVPVGWLVCT